MIIGLTGGIGSGKTTVGKIFNQLGVPVYEADAASKEIIDTDQRLQQSLKDLLGNEVVQDNGLINRSFMSQKIFNDQDLLQKVNALIHPAVGRDFEQWVKKQRAAYVIKEAAILFESGTYKQCNLIVVVTAPKKLRIQRVMERNQMKREEVLARMDRQWPEEKKAEMADYVIDNGGNRSLIKQVIHIHEDIISRTNTRSR